MRCATVFKRARTALFLALAAWIVRKLWRWHGQLPRDCPAGVPGRDIIRYGRQLAPALLQCSARL